jgi:hypothetical protein
MMGRMTEGVIVIIELRTGVRCMEDRVGGREMHSLLFR